MTPPLLVSPKWLSENLGDRRLRVIENAWDKELYARGHIPGAIPTPYHPHLKHFDVKGEKTAHLLNQAEFREFCTRLGLRTDRHYVIYDDWNGLFSARFWWVCRYYGMENVSVLNGGWQGWQQAGYPVEATVRNAEEESNIKPSTQSQLLIEKDELLEMLGKGGFRVWDTRRNAEYIGTELSDNLRQGHIPGAVNLDWTSFLEAARGDHPRPLHSLEACRQLALAAGLVPNATIVPYCQNGIRAAFGFFVLSLLGYSELRLYDGSLFEWANLAEPPLEF